MSANTQETRTVTDIKYAFLQIMKEKRLDEITMSELARRANVSRSTLYNHFGNVVDVYESVMREFRTNLVTPVSTAIEMDGEGGVEEGRKPFCQILREAHDYQPILRDHRFIDRLIADRSHMEKHDVFHLLVDHGYSGKQAWAICAFQLVGCYTIATMSQDEDDADWESMHRVMDRFIKGGIDFLLETEPDTLNQQTCPTSEA